VKVEAAGDAIEKLFVEPRQGKVEVSLGQGGLRSGGARY
jgi:hypothetical protein